MSSLKPHKRTAVRTRVGTAAAAMAIIMGLAPATAVATPVNPLAELGNRLDSVSNFPTNVVVLEGIELPDDGFEIPDSISLSSSSGEDTDPNTPKPTSYRPNQIARLYPSGAATDSWFYFYVVRPFMELERSHPEAMDQNLKTVIHINNATKNSLQAQELAFDGNYLDPLTGISTAFGANLSQHFHDTFDEGRLPKVRALLSGNLARGGGLVSSALFEKYTCGYDCPFVVASEHIKRYYREGQGDPYSATSSYPSGHTNKVT